ncbi:hypothetical protein GYH30_042446 [Glycine max]|uniref:TIR domain-containing protein n=1 Tax=Glycine max TaxID=3847 RepID=A0A0R0G9S6_SOYBN|nr:hypothetical protein GYH30_042446 [Glycine max]
MQCRGRVFCLEDEPGVYRVWMPNDYASSRWCLDELVTILECREKYGQIIIPVFYYVKPTDVRHQMGSYENAFAEHEKEYKTKVDNWR